jgi:hypothetical protein
MVWEDPGGTEATAGAGISRIGNEADAVAGSPVDRNGFDDENGNGRNEKDGTTIGMGDGTELEECLPAGLNLRRTNMGRWSLTPPM